MTQTTIKLNIPFESLLKGISELKLEEKRKLWKILEREISLAETGKIHVNDNPGYKPTGEILKIEEIRSRYPQEWVLIADLEADEQLNIIQGEILAHSPNRKEIDQALIKFKNVKSIAIEYTGSIPSDYSVLL